MCDIDNLTSKLKDICISDQRISKSLKNNNERYIIIKNIYKYCNKLNNLKKIKYQNITLEYKSIILFHIISSKETNNTTNKIRETMICCIINNIIPNEYFRYSRLWKKLKNSVSIYIDKIFSGVTIKDISCKLLGNRQNHIDFKFIVKTNDNKEIIKNIEFKFNIIRVDNCPQFLSLAANIDIVKKYAEFFYDKYLKEIADSYNINMIDKNTYLKCIKSTNPNINIFFKKIYDYEKNYEKNNKKNNKKINDNILINFKKEIVDKSIHDYITTYADKFDINKLRNNLLDSQRDKIYMLYNLKTHTFNIDKIYDNELKLLNKYTLKIEKSGIVHKIIYETESKTSTIGMSLRWSNRQGILNPSVQIELKR